jgi:dsDNA-specific endonuclease/ATPase MutS2
VSILNSQAPSLDATVLIVRIPRSAFARAKAKEPCQRVEMPSVLGSFASLVLSPDITEGAGASIRVSDSLQGGVSRFYAEILRLRQILDETAGPLPVLFLIDEFLHGTNSHDRRIGAEALVRGLIDRGAIGLITTHDLALAEIADVLADRAGNVHFEDQIENGQIRFDYLMRPGVVRKSNAIELMRSVGLEI